MVQMYKQKKNQHISLYFMLDVYHFFVGIIGFPEDYMSIPEE